MATAPGGDGVDVVFDDPESRRTRAEAVAAAPRVLSFDIETDAAAERLLAISLYGLGADEVLIVDPAARPMPPGARGAADEAPCWTRSARGSPSSIRTCSPAGTSWISI